MEAGWYLKTADAPEAHWWDGTQYTTHTSPLTGYPFAVHPDPLAAPVVVAPPAPPVAPEPVVAEPEVAAEPPVEVAEELPVVEEPVIAEPVVAEPVADASVVEEPAVAPIADAVPAVEVPPIVEPPFTPPTLTAPQFGPPEPTVPVAQNFGPPQPTVPLVSQAGPPLPTYGAPQATPGPYIPPAADTATAPRKGMNKGLLWGIIGGGALILIIIIVLIANLLASVFAANPITAPIAPPVPTSGPATPAPSGDPVELPDDSNSTGTREIDQPTREIFVGLVTSSIPTLASESESSIVDAGLAVCEMFDEGQDVTSIGEVLTSSGLPVSEAGLFLGYSVALLCPEYTDSVG